MATAEPAGPAQELASLTADDMAGWPGTPMALMTQAPEDSHQKHVADMRDEGRKMAQEFARLTATGLDTLVAALMTADAGDSREHFGIARGLEVPGSTLTQFIFTKVSRETDLTGLNPIWKNLNGQAVLASQSHTLTGSPGALLIVPETVYPALQNRRPDTPGAILLETIMRWHGNYENRMGPRRWTSASGGNRPPGR